MEEFLIKIMRCPECKGRLYYDEEGHILFCGACRMKFGFSNGKPLLFSNGLRSDVIPSKVLKPPLSKRGKVIRDIPQEPNEDILSLIPHTDDGNSAKYVLDYGCGNSGYKDALVSMGYRYMGIDISDGGASLLCDGHKLPFADNQFSFVFCRAVMEHMKNPFVAAAELYRVVENGGYILGSVSFLEPYHQSSCFHMSFRGCYNLLVSTGFSPLNLWVGWDIVDAAVEMGYLSFLKNHRCLLALIKFPLKLLLLGPGLTIRSREKKPNLRLPFAGSIIFFAKKTV